MAARRTPPPSRSSFQPTNESATYKDLLLFEERLKTNAAILRRRKSRYQLFLFQLLAIIAFLMSEVFLQTQFMIIPYKVALRKFLPPESNTRKTQVQLHPYFPKALLLVAITTLVLFFASGLYAEKIGYADRYIHHANRSLRNFNMYLNVRHRPLRSRLLVNPISFFRYRDSAEDAYTPPPRSRSPSPDRRRRRMSSVPIQPIPPATNPRGELIFSSRVDRMFRESYERYRAAFERKREEREMYAAAQTWWGWRVWPWNWMRRRLLPPSSYIRAHSPTSSVASPGRGRASDTESASSTPGSSRRSSPVPGRTRGGVGGGRNGSQPSGIPSRLVPDRARTESFSFLLSGNQSFG